MTRSYATTTTDSNDLITILELNDFGDWGYISLLHGKSLLHHSSNFSKYILI